MTERLFAHVALVGVGLIGGSLAWAARRAGVVGTVVGCGRSVANLQVAQQRGIIDRYTVDVTEAVQQADLIIVAVPVRAIASVIQACAESIAPGAVVIDVGSVKAPVVEAVDALLPPQVSFVGTHPIAGTEESGAAAARIDLFEGSRCVVTPGTTATPEAVRRVTRLWECVGMDVVSMAAARHDQVLAWVSHLSHVFAYSVVNALGDVDPEMADFAGPSFQSLTRVAASDPEMWGDIFSLNATPVVTALDQCLAAVETLRDAIARQDDAQVNALLTRAQALRRGMNAVTA